MKRATLSAMANETPLRDPQSFAIIGAAMAVHTELGCGFLEAVYRASLMVEFEARGIPFRTEVRFPMSYKERPLPLHYRADLVCFTSIVVEVKALRAIGPVEQAQTINYLKVSHLRARARAELRYGQSRISASRAVGPGPGQTFLCDSIVCRPAGGRSIPAFVSA
jgi:GxxExxY protein